MRDTISTQEKSIVRRSFTLIHERFAVLFAAAAWPYAVTALCFLAVGFSYRLLHSPADYDPREVWTSMAPLQKFGVIFAYLVSISIPGDLAKASVTSSVWEDLQGNPVRVRAVKDPPRLRPLCRPFSDRGLRSDGRKCVLSLSRTNSDGPVFPCHPGARD